MIYFDTASDAKLQEHSSWRRVPDDPVVDKVRKGGPLPLRCQRKTGSFKEEQAMVGTWKIREPGKGDGVRSHIPWSADDC